MVKTPWVLTRDMFLAEQEVNDLKAFLQRQLEAAAADEQHAAATDQVIIQGLVYSGLRNSEFCRLRVVDTILGIGESVFRVVVIGVILTVSKILHHFGRSIEDVFRRHQGSRMTRRFHSLSMRAIDSVGFWGCPEINHQLGNG